MNVTPDMIGAFTRLQSLCTRMSKRSWTSTLFPSVTRESEHTTAQALPGLGGRVGEGARRPRHDRRDQQVADGRRA